MLEFLIDNIYVVFGDQVFQQSIGYPIITNCGPLFADLFLYSYEAEIMQNLMYEKKKILAVAFNSTFRYIDDVLSINNGNFHSYVDTIYLGELEIKISSASDTSVLYLDIFPEKDVNGNLTFKLYDKRDD